MQYCYYDSPMGRLLLAGNQGLASLHFPVGRTRVAPEEDWTYASDNFSKALSQLKAYFNGTLFRFDLDLDLQGSVFQKKVWQELVRIPYGETISYGELAERIGNPNAARAVGMANGRNPVSIIVPCHRVIGKSGHLTGFGGGLDVKQKLLEHEKRNKKRLV